MRLKNLTWCQIINTDWEKQSKQIPQDSENSVFLKISKNHGQIQTQGPKLSGNHAPHV